MLKDSKKGDKIADIKPANLPHTVDNLVITCMDRRFQKCIAKMLSDEHGVDIEHSDRLVYPGSSKAVADGTLIHSIQTSFRLHNIKNIWLFDHTDCGGFGGMKAYGRNEQKEAEAHFGSQKRARATIHKTLPSLIVNTFVIGMDGKEIKPGVGSQ